MKTIDNKFGTDIQKVGPGMYIIKTQNEIMYTSPVSTYRMEKPYENNRKALYKHTN